MAVNVVPLLKVMICWSAIPSEPLVKTAGSSVNVSPTCTWRSCQLSAWVMWRSPRNGVCVAAGGRVGNGTSVSLGGAKVDCSCGVTGGADGCQGRVMLYRRPGGPG